MSREEGKLVCEAEQAVVRCNCLGSEQLVMLSSSFLPSPRLGMKHLVCCIFLSRHILLIDSRKIFTSERFTNDSPGFALTTTSYTSPYAYPSHIRASNRSPLAFHNQLIRRPLPQRLERPHGHHLQHADVGPEHLLPPRAHLDRHHRVQP